VQATYNFEVADINTFYVSAAKVLVHNCDKTGLSEKDKLNRSLASEEQVGELNNGGVERIAGGRD
jgi:hypothetical protein